MKNQASRKENSQSGNIFFWIFAMIALFGALSYTMSQGFRSSANDLTDQQAKIAATEMITYGNQVRDAIKSLIISNGCKETEIGFDNTIYTAYNGTPANGPNHNPNTPGDQCKVFKKSGGGLSPVVFPHQDDVFVSPTKSKAGHGWFARAKIPGVGSSNEDLIMTITAVDTNICMEINKLMGIENPNNAPPEESATGEGYDGAFLEDSDGPSALFTGKRSGCFHMQASPYPQDNVFTHVLLAR